MIEVSRDMVPGEKDGICGDYQWQQHW